MVVYAASGGVIVVEGENAHDTAPVVIGEEGGH